MSGSERIKVLIADDHPFLRLGLETILRTQPDMQLVGQASDGAEAVRLAILTRPDVIVLDVRMPTKDGLTALVEIAQAWPTARCLVFTSFNDTEQMLQAIKLGAAGYLLKEAGPDELLRAIRTVHQGEGALHPAATQQLIKAYQTLQDSGQNSHDLTNAEVRVLKLLTRGLSNRQLAVELGVSQRTVTTHIRHIFDKLGVGSRIQAALYARDQGLSA